MVKEPDGHPTEEEGWKKTLDKVLDEEIFSKDLSRKLTKRELLARKMVELAFRGDQRAIERILERTEGKAVERVREVDAKDNDLMDRREKLYLDFAALIKKID